MLVNQKVSAPWSSPFCWFDTWLHTTGSGSFHSPTLLTGFVGECSFVGEFGVSLESAFSILIGRRHIGFFPEPHTPFTKLEIALFIFKRWSSLMLIAK